MDKRFIAIYENENEATSAVENLKEQGYTSDQISIVAKNIDKLPNEAEEVSPAKTDGLVAGAAAGGAARHGDPAGHAEVPRHRELVPHAGRHDERPAAGPLTDPPWRGDRRPAAPVDLGRVEPLRARRDVQPRPHDLRPRVHVGGLQ